MDYKQIFDDLLVFLLGSAITWAFAQLVMLRVRTKKFENDLNHAFAMIRGLHVSNRSARSGSYISCSPNPEVYKRGLGKKRAKDIKDKGHKT